MPKGTIIEFYDNVTGKDCELQIRYKAENVAFELAFVGIGNESAPVKFQISPDTTREIATELERLCDELQTESEENDED